MSYPLDDYLPDDEVQASDAAADFEGSLIGAAMLDPAAFELAGIAGDEFTDPGRGAIWDAIGRLIAEGRDVDPSAVIAYATEDGTRINAAALPRYVGTGTTGNVGIYVDAIRRANRSRALAAAFSAAALDAHHGDVDKAVNRVSEALEAAGSHAGTRLDVGTLRQVLDRPEPPRARIDGMLPWEGGLLLTAQRKAGKTTLMLNFARSLLTGEPFLGVFPVRPVKGTVAFLNFEVSAAQLARWADDHELDPDRLVLANFRGQVNPFDDAGRRRLLARELRAREAETVIVDPFQVAFKTGTSQNDSGEVGGWLAQLDIFARSEVGALDVALSAHAGWNPNHTRGSSALEGWADALWLLKRDDDSGTRSLAVQGRDVPEESSQLTFDQTTRALRWSGETPRAALEREHIDQLERAVVAAVQDKPGLNVTALEGELRGRGFSFQRGDVGRAAKNAAACGHLRVESGSRNSKNYFPGSVLPSTPELSHGSVPSTPDPYKGSGSTGTTRDTAEAGSTQALPLGGQHAA